MPSKNYKSYKKRVKYVLTEQEQKALKSIRKILMTKIKSRIRKKTGQLKKGFGTSIIKKNKQLKLGYKKKGFYGGFIELGTKNIQEDPVLLPAIEESKEEIQNIIKTHLGKLGN